MSDFRVPEIGNIGKAENSLPPCPDNGEVFSWKDKLARNSIFTLPSDFGTLPPQFGTGTTAFQGRYS